MTKRGEYQPPNGKGLENNVQVLDLFNDPTISWPKGAHWWHYVEENETFALWLLNMGAGSVTTAIERARRLARFLDIMGWTLDDMMDQVIEDQRKFERKLEVLPGARSLRVMLREPLITISSRFEAG